MPDARSVEQIREDIECTQKAISSTVKRLDSRINRVLDWRIHVSRNPIAAAAIAAAVGAAAGLIVRRPRRSPFERVADSVVAVVEDLGYQLGEELDTGESATRLGRKTQQDRCRRAAPAIAVVVARATVDFLRQTEQSRAGEPRHAPAEARPDSGRGRSHEVRTLKEEK